MGVLRVLGDLGVLGVQRESWGMWGPSPTERRVYRDAPPELFKSARIYPNRPAWPSKSSAHMRKSGGKKLAKSIKICKNLKKIKQNYGKPFGKLRKTNGH